MNKHYFKGIDTFRGLAILFIILYHLLPATFSGGFLGVDMFFIISGFLVGKSIELNHKNTNIVSFTIYKIKPLIKPLFWFLVFWSTFLTLFSNKLLSNYFKESVSSLLFVNNWFQVASGNSYFAKFINPSTLSHLWFLGTIMQLYILWYIIIKLTNLMSKIIKRDIKLYVYIAITIISFLIMAFTFVSGGDPTRVYYGTDCRIFSFSLGAIASLYNIGNLNSNIKEQNTKKLDIISLVATFIVILMMLFVNDTSAFTYRGGMLIFDILFSIILVAVTTKESIYSKIISKSIVLGSLGKISFFVYLWYYPISVFWTNATFTQNLSHFSNVVIPIIIMIAMGLLFYILFNVKNATFPIYNFDEIIHIKSSLSNLFNKENKSRVKQVIFIVISCCFIISTLGISLAKNNKKVSVSLEKTIKNNSNIIKKKNLEKKDGKTLTEIKKEGSNSKKLSNYYSKLNIDDKKTVDDLATVYEVDKEALAFVNKLNITFIGDSILEASSLDLVKIFPNSYIDGKISRQFYQAPALLENLKKIDKLYDVVVILLGTNGYVKESNIEDTMKILGPKRNVFLVNVVNGLQWSNSVNETLHHYVKSDKTGNIHLINWNEYLKLNTGLLEPDNTHPNIYGSKKLSKLILDNLYSTLVK